MPRFAAAEDIRRLHPAPLSLNPEEPMLEYDQSSHPFRGGLVYTAISMKDGEGSVPRGAGVGVDADREILHQFRKPTASV